MDLNHRPTAYESAALPLSYTATSAVYIISLDIILVAGEGLPPEADKLLALRYINW